MQERIYKFSVQGMHCKACEYYLETQIKARREVTSVIASIKDNSILVKGNFDQEVTAATLASDLTKAVWDRGYRITTTAPEVRPKRWRDLILAAPIAIIFIGIFIALQKFGIVNLVSSSEVTYVTAFIVGVVASLSTCMAVVGGLLLSISATYAKQQRAAKQHIIFHFGRLASFFLLGGFIGALGSAFHLNGTMNFILGASVAIVMLVLGLNLLEVFDWARKLQPAIPRFVWSKAGDVTRVDKGSVTPLLLGLVTFFLPCGFTQSMQIYTLTTGSFTQGALTMLSFALGTLPVLALISFSFFRLQNKPKSGIMFKAAGIVVIAFALFNLINSLVVAGVLPPVFNF